MNNKELLKLIQQNTEMKEQIAELEDRHRRSNSRFNGHEGEIWSRK